MKNVFYDVFGYVNPENVSQKCMTTDDGIQVLLISSEESAMIMVDRDDSFLTVGVEGCSMNELEQVAMLFDFTIQVNPLNPSEAHAREEISTAQSNAEDPFA